MYKSLIIRAVACVCVFFLGGGGEKGGQWEGGFFQGVGQRMSGENYRQLLPCCLLALQTPNNTIKR